MSSRESWKASERRMASILGGERVPVTGRSRGSAPDIEGVTWAGRRLAIEHKYGRRILSARLGTAIDQAKAAAREASDIGVVTIEETGHGHVNRRMVLVDAVELVQVIAWYEARIRLLEGPPRG